MPKGKARKPIVASSRRVGRVMWTAAGLGLAAVVTAGITVFAGRAIDGPPPVVTRSTADSQLNASALPVVNVYKSPTCGCCSKWVEHLRAAGFDVRTTDLHDLSDLKASHGVPPQAGSCHTAAVAGYAVEGHVPAPDIQRLLRERPAISGLAVPGMPIGSPGMEVPGTKAQPFDVIAFDEDARTGVFASHGGEH